MKEDFLKSVSFELKRIRENLNYTIKEVSEKLGYSQNLISRYENGKPTDLNIFLNLLNFYDVRADIFFKKVYAYTYISQR